MLYNLRLTLLIICLLFFSCKKNVPGPQGDKGTAGSQGNLKITTTIGSPTIWTPINKGWKSYMTVPEITQSVIEKGEVEVYVQVGNTWWKLPYAVKNLFTKVTVEKDYLNFEYTVIHDEVPPNPGTLNFRVVITEPVTR